MRYITLIILLLINKSFGFLINNDINFIFNVSEYNITNDILIQSFSSWIIDFKKFIKNNKFVIDHFVLTIINDIFNEFDNLLKKYPSGYENNILGNVHHLSKYTNHHSNNCIDKYKKIENLTCFILSKKYKKTI